MFATSWLLKAPTEGAFQLGTLPPIEMELFIQVREQQFLTQACPKLDQRLVVMGSGPAPPVFIPVVPTDMGGMGSPWGQQVSSPASTILRI